MEIQWATDVGMKRKNNEDAAGIYYNQQQQPLALLADGMGGHQAGDVASHLLVKKLGNEWEKTTEFASIEKLEQWMQDQLQKQNDYLVQLGRENEEMSGMGTTIVMATAYQQQMVIAHVGDSRAYLLRDDQLLQLTEDHSLVNELYRSGEITKEMAEKHPQKNILTRTIGVPEVLKVDFDAQLMQSNDLYLICSDGLTNMLTEQQIADIMEQKKLLEDRVHFLIRAANQAGGKDNITVILIKLGDEGRTN